MKEVDYIQLIGKDFQIWHYNNNGSDFFQMQLRQLRSTPPLFEPHYEIKFPIHPFSSKLNYYMRVIDNAIISYINSFYKYKIEDDRELIAFHLKKNDDRVCTGLKKYNLFIENYHYYLEELLSDNQSLNSNFTLKESVALSYYMFWSIIYCHLEIQHLMNIYINPDDKKTVEDLFYWYLKRRPPKTPVIYLIEGSKQAEVESLQEKLKREPKQVQVFYEVMEEVGFFRIHKTSALSDNAKLVLMRKLVEPDGTPFFVAMVKELGYDDYYYRLIEKEEPISLCRKLRKANGETVSLETYKRNYSSFTNEAERIKYKAFDRRNEVKQFYENLTNIK